MDQDITWYGDRPHPSWHCVRWGPSSPHGKEHSGTGRDLQSPSPQKISSDKYWRIVDRLQLEKSKKGEIIKYVIVQFKFNIKFIGATLCNVHDRCVRVTDAYDQIMCCCAILWICGVRDIMLLRWKTVPGIWNPVAEITLCTIRLQYKCRLMLQNLMDVFVCLGLRLMRKWLLKRRCWWMFFCCPSNCIMHQNILHDSSVLCWGFNCDLFCQVQSLRSAVCGLALKCLADMYRYLKKDMVGVSNTCHCLCIFAGYQWLSSIFESQHLLITCVAEIPMHCIWWRFDWPIGLTLRLYDWTVSSDYLSFYFQFLH